MLWEFAVSGVVLDCEQDIFGNVSDGACWWTLAAVRARRAGATRSEASWSAVNRGI